MWWSFNDSAKKNWRNFTGCYQNHLKFSEWLQTAASTFTNNLGKRKIFQQTIKSGKKSYWFKLSLPPYNNFSFPKVVNKCWCSRLESFWKFWITSSKISSIFFAESLKLHHNRYPGSFPKPLNKFYFRTD